MSLRLAEPSDAEALADLHAKGFPGRSWSTSFFEDATSSRTDVTLLTGCPPKGFVMLRLLGPEAEILTITAHPRGAGTGALLLKGAIDAAASHGAKCLFLEVSVANKAALHLYRGFGFTRAGLRRGYYDTGEDAALLRCDIRAKGEE
jgi:ribosomal-protein-alanine N-acetyltransferase